LGFRLIPAKLQELWLTPSNSLQFLTPVSIWPAKNWLFSLPGSFSFNLFPKLLNIACKWLFTRASVFSYD